MESMALILVDDIDATSAEDIFAARSRLAGR